MPENQNPLPVLPASPALLKFMAFSATDTSMSSWEHLGVGITVCKQSVHSAFSYKFPRVSP